MFIKNTYSENETETKQPLYISNTEGVITVNIYELMLPLQYWGEAIHSYVSFCYISNVLPIAKSYELKSLSNFLWKFIIFQIWRPYKIFSVFEKWPNYEYIHSSICNFTRIKLQKHFNIFHRNFARFIFISTYNFLAPSDF